MTRVWRDEGAVECVIAADPDTVYARIADVTTTGDRSVECRSCEWLRGAAPGSVGARFRGHNRSGLARWSRVCEVTEAEPGRRFSFRTVPERLDPMRADSTTWSYLLVPEGAGTRVTHAYRITKWPAGPFKWLYGRVFPQHRDMRPQMTQTLEALRAELEVPDPSSRSA
jgi:Polyketide cyclase / dehydrase and lipid transport